MKLYYSPGTCSLSPHIVLREAGYDVELVKVDLKTKKTEDGADFNTIAEKSAVPLLVLDDGQVLTEGVAIVQFLADGKPKANLVPAAGTFERVRLQEWLNYISTEIHKGFSPLFKPQFGEQAANFTREQLGKKFDYLSGKLKNQPYLLGEVFSVADAYLFTVLGWCGHVGIELAKWPVLEAYRARIMERPAVQEAMKAEGLLAAKAA